MSATPAEAAFPYADLVAMLGMIGSQVQAALDETNGPAATLVDTAHTVTGASQTVARCLFELSGSPARMFEELVTLQSKLHAHAGKAGTAIQFHDRLVQSLSHVCISLGFLAEFIAQHETPASAQAWSQLREKIRNVFSMERERMVFDRMNDGAGNNEIDRAVVNSQSGAAGSIELF